MRVSNCTALAAALSASYRNTEPFIAGDNLNDYLQSHGVLLTMCMGNFCAIDPNRATHVSGSWINQLTGPKVIAGPTIGLILSSNVTSIRCMYPSDAATDGRDDKGCGPMMTDLRQGSQGYAKSGRIRRFEMKIALEKLLKLNFGKSSDIPCESVFNMQPPGGWSLWKGKDGNLTFPESLKEIADQYSPFLGRPVCNVSKPRQTPELLSFWLYFEAASWKPEEFQRIPEIMKTLGDTNRNKLLWNEIVMDLPVHMSDIVSAVFYIPDQPFFSHYHEQAVMQAKLLGVPLLVMDRTSNGDLFSCAPEEPSKAINNGVDIMATQQILPQIHHPFIDVVAARKQDLVG